MALRRKTLSGAAQIDRCDRRWKTGWWCPDRAQSPAARPQRATRRAVGGSLNSPPLLDDVVHRHHVGLTRIHAQFGEDRHQGLAKGIKVLLRVPHVVDHEAGFRAKRRVMRAALRLALPDCFELLHDFVVLPCGHRLWMKVNRNRHDPGLSQATTSMALAVANYCLPRRHKARNRRTHRSSLSVSAARRRQDRHQRRRHREPTHRNRTSQTRITRRMHRWSTLCHRLPARPQRSRIQRGLDHVHTPGGRWHSRRDSQSGQPA